MYRVYPKAESADRELIGPRFFSAFMVRRIRSPVNSHRITEFCAQVRQAGIPIPSCANYMLLAMPSFTATIGIDAIIDQKRRLGCVWQYMDTTRNQGYCSNCACPIRRSQRGVACSKPWAPRSSLIQAIDECRLLRGTRRDCGNAGVAGDRLAHCAILKRFVLRPTCAR